MTPLCFPEVLVINMNVCDPVLANILAPMLLLWMGWKVLWWVGAGIAVELVLIKLVFRIEWLRAVKLGLLLNLGSTIAGIVLVLLGPILLGMAYGYVFFWILQLVSATFISAHVQRMTADAFLVPIQDPFMMRWLMLVNVIGIGIASSSVWFDIDWYPLFW